MGLSRPKCDVALPSWVWHVLGECGMALVGSGCEIVSLGIHRVWNALTMCLMSSVCVSYAQWVWLVNSGCGISSVGVECPQWGWHVPSGCGIALVCDIASVGVA